METIDVASNACQQDVAEPSRPAPSAPRRSSGSRAHGAAVLALLSLLRLCTAAPPVVRGSPAPPGPLFDRESTRGPARTAPGSGADAREAAADEADDEEDEASVAARSFLYKELVLSGFYAPEGIVGVPPGDLSQDHVEFSPRPPGNYAGVDYVRTFNAFSFINRLLLPDWLPLRALDLHPRVLFDRMEASDDPDRFKLAFQDFWVRLNPGEVDRLLLRIGQFVIPYGVSPILAPRQRFMLPLEATDLGLKWDWGLNLKGPVGQHDWEIAASIGSGEALRSTYLLESSDRTSYLLTGRIGAPTYWDFQYGLSFLYGDLPFIRAAKRMGEVATSRWRVGLDTFHKAGTYLMGGLQLTYGQDGFAGDERFVTISGGEVADVLGYRAFVDWVVPGHLDLRFAAQFESIFRDLSTSNTDDTALILETGYSVTTTTTLMLDFRMELNRSMGEESDAIFFTFVYYGR